MPSRIFLSNDGLPGVGGVTFDEEYFQFGQASETSALAGSASLVPLFIAKQNGVIADVVVGVALPGVSASGWVSGTVDATVRINSAAVCSTNPAINMAGSAGQATRKSTNSGGGVSAVVNVASAAFSAGDQISVDWNARSVGSAAATAAGQGFTGGVIIRYAAR